MDLWGVWQVGTDLWPICLEVDCKCCSELADPQKLLTYLLQPSTVKLSPDTIAVYIQAATKIFGYWAAEIAQRWDDNLLSEVKDVVDIVIERVGYFCTSSHIDVQERVSPLFSPICSCCIP